MYNAVPRMFGNVLAVSRSLLQLERRALGYLGLYVISLAGTWLSTTTIQLTVDEATKSFVAQAWIQLAGAVGHMIMVICVTYRLAHRFGERWLIVACDALAFLLAIAFAALVVGGVQGAMIIGCACGLRGLIAGLRQMPDNNFVSTFTAKDGVRQAIYDFRGTVFHLVKVLAMPAAGALAAWGLTCAAFLGDAVTFLVICGFVWWMFPADKRNSQEKGVGLRDIVNFIREEREVAPLLLLVTIFHAFVFTGSNFFPRLVHSHLCSAADSAKFEYGLMMGIAGCCPAAMLFVRRWHPAWMCAFAVLCPAGIIGVALAPHWFPAALCYGATLFSSNILIVSTSGMIAKSKAKRAGFAAQTILHLGAAPLIGLTIAYMTPRNALVEGICYPAFLAVVLIGLLFVWKHKELWRAFCSCRPE